MYSTKSSTGGTYSGSRFLNHPIVLLPFLLTLVIL
jgi:hypothetical protein